MKIKSISYKEHAGEKQEWSLEEFNLANINLLVGKNAVGKTRTLNILSGLAKLLGNDQNELFLAGEWKVNLENSNSETMQYDLAIEEQKVTREKLTIENETKLTRSKEGKGEIYYANEKKLMKFQSPETELASYSRRDTLQHPFLDELNKWANSVHHYLFGEHMGKTSYLAPVENKGSKQYSKDVRHTVKLFETAEKKFGEQFKKQVIANMNEIAYHISEVGVDLVQWPKTSGDFPLNGIKGLYVVEKDLDCKTWQYAMSQGMFRALSLIIHLVYSKLSNQSSLILIDDIGEGLDFDRSTALIKIIIEMLSNSQSQIIMTSNDRFVMNNVPLEYWCVIQREGSKCRVFNYENSKEIFDRFEFTGLSNFDFLSTEFYLNGLD